YWAGNVYQATHTMDIDKLGGLGKRMPHTAFLFLIAALAICGLPPFNGFVSEFLIYNGLFTGLHGSDKALLSYIVGGLFGLALIGGLAMLCFTKAFGSVFLGTARHYFNQAPEKTDLGKLIPMYAVVILMMTIGLFPKAFIGALSKPVGLFTHNTPFAIQSEILPVTEAVSMIGICAMGFLLLTGLIYLIRKQMTINKPQYVNATWGCGYVASTGKMQYTASSFIRAYRKLAEPFLSISKKKKEITGIFPKKGGQETHPYDKAEEWLIDYPLHLLKTFFNRFVFLQNGNLQFYILYGIVFILLVLGIPFVFDYIKSLLKFLNGI
ncbi:MAG: proton-conducting transporter membrane subunit, partial [Bacteroidota bacterium]